jgi:diguanylate cyclase (GGDEF)-like protein
VVVTRDGDEAWRVLDSEAPPQLAILDWMMPGLDGVELCRRVRSKGHEPYVYCILLTALNREADLVAGMEAGADDYLTKPFNAEELRVRLRAGRRIIEQQEELIAAREALRIKATHDPLTGLWNHDEIIGILQRELTRAVREKSPVGVIMADLDHFKLINDTHGHLAGDAVLRGLARKFLSVTRPYDTIGRFGGEEFLIVLPGCGREAAAGFAERVRRSIAADKVDTAEGLVAITISLGVTASSEGQEDGEALVKEADVALYRAKEQGRNRVEVAVADTAAGSLVMDA